MSQPKPTKRVQFGPFVLDRKSLDLTRDGRPVTLQHQPKRVLAFLLENPGRVVLRQELQEHLWGDRFVDADQGLNNAVRQIRRALEDRAERPTFVQTIPRVGYRFLAPVESVNSGAPEEDPVMEQPAVRRLQAAVLGGLLLLAAGVAGLWWMSSSEPALSAPSSQPLRLAVLPLSDLDEPSLGPPAALLMEEMITALSSFDTDRLVVIAGTSTQKFADRPRDLSAVARELNAEYLVEGAIHWDGEKIAFLVRLIRAEGESIVWAERFTFHTTELSSGARAVAGHLARALPGFVQEPEGPQNCLAKSSPN